MLWAFGLLLPFIVKADDMSDECNYVDYWGMSYATDRCNSYVYRSSYYLWEQSYIFRCAWDGNGVYLEWYDNWNCSGWPYYWDYNSSLGQFNCNGTESCFMSVTGYNLDQPCGESYTDSYWYSVYSQDICVIEDYWYFDSRISCDSNGAQIDLFYSNDSCSGDDYYSYSYSEVCNISYNPYTRYKINCSAENEPLPVPEYQDHYCDTHSCWVYPTPAPTVPYSSQINRNDANSCAYVNWYGEPVAPNRCYYYKYFWGNYTYIYSTKFQCNDANDGVDVAVWYGNEDCTSNSGIYSWNSTYGVTDFNCIGHTECHAEYYNYELKNMSDPECPTITDSPVSHWIYATDICVDSYYGYPQRVTCDNNKIHINTYWNISGCSGYSSQWTIADGCNNPYNSSYYQYYTKFTVNCNAEYTTTKSGSGGNGKNDAQSTKTTTAVISATVVIVVLLLIGALFVTYLTRKARFQTKIDKTGMLSDTNAKADEIFNEDGRGIRNTAAPTNTNTSFEPVISDFNPPITNTVTFGERQEEFPKTMSLVGMQGDEDGDGDNFTR